MFVARGRLCDVLGKLRVEVPLACFPLVLLVGGVGCGREIQAALRREVTALKSSSLVEGLQVAILLANFQYATSAACTLPHGGRERHLRHGGCSIKSHDESVVWPAAAVRRCLA